MAIVLVEGFDAYNGISGNAGSPSAGGWVLGSATYTSLAAGRFGGQAFSKSSSTAASAYLYKVFGSITQGCLGFALKVTTYTTAASGCLVYLTTDNLSSQLGLRVGTGGEISIGRASGSTSDGLGTILGTTSNGVIPLNTWCYIEMEFVISDSVGSINLYVSGTNVLSLSNVDTKANATLSTVTTLYLGDSNSTGGRGVCLYDDIYMTNTPTRLGEQRVETLYPNADTAQKQWTASTGSDNFAMIDETLMSTTDYVYTSTVNNYDLYDFGNLSSTPTSISAVTVNALAQKDNVATRAIATPIKSGSTTSDGANVYLSGGWALSNQLYATDPNTSSAWTASAVNSIQAGVKVTI